MQIVERGHGAPLVLVPGIQGRWEWIEGVVNALAGYYRVLTFSLGDEPSAQWANLRDGVDGFADQIDSVLDSRGIRKAFICGISFGGLVALRYAARTPERVQALVLVSTPGPGWHMKERHTFYSQFPLILAPVFAIEAGRRMFREIRALYPTRLERLRFAARYTGTAVTAPGSASRMARRARAIDAHDRAADAGRIECPTLVLHGEPALDHVVDAGGTREYATRIRGAQVATLERTGHLGFATRPDEFARIVHQFLARTTLGSHDSAA